jgi:hypothetical protein
MLTFTLKCAIYPNLITIKKLTNLSPPPLAELATLISESNDLSRSIESLPVTSFDPKDQYPEVLGAVRAAAAENNPDATQEAVELKVYRIEITTTRIEYWILALHAPEKKIVGLRAKAVES